MQLKSYPVIKSGLIKTTYFTTGETVELSAIDAQTYFAQGLIGPSETQKKATVKTANKTQIGDSK